MSRKPFAPAEHLVARTDGRADERPAGTPRHLAPSRRRRTLAHALSGAFLALALALVTALGLAPDLAEAATDTFDGPTQGIDEGSRIADYDTHDSYIGQLLGGDIYGSLTPNYTDADGNTTNTIQSFTTNGTRYAGRLWADKSVFANGSKEGSEQNPSTGNAWNEELNQLNLSIATDGYRGAVATNDDFMHVYSVLGSSQVENVYPSSPVDLVIVFDMSGSMACAADGMAYGDTYSSLVPEDGDQPGYLTHGTFEVEGNTSGEEAYTGYGISEGERIAGSRIKATVKAINQTVDSLMEQNSENRVAVVGYGASAAVLMPLHHYTPSPVPHPEDGGSSWTDYITVSNMYQLMSNASYADSYGTLNDEGYWLKNVDAAYTLTVDADWVKLSCESKSVPEKGSADAKFSNGFYGSGKYFNEGDVTYIGCLTSTQGGIYLGFEQLAKADGTVYSEKGKGASGKATTLPRIPSLILMTDGGANFAYRNGTPQGRFAPDGEGAAAVNTWVSASLYDSNSDTYTIEIPPGHEFNEQKKEYEVYSLRAPGQSAPPKWEGDADVYNQTSSDKIKYSFNWSNATTYDLSDAILYIPINSVFDTDNLNIEDIEAERTITTNGDPVTTPIAESKIQILNGPNAEVPAFNTGYYYEYDKYVKIELDDIESTGKGDAHTPGDTTVSETGHVDVCLEVREDLLGKDINKTVQFNGGMVTMTGLMTGINGFTQTLTRKAPSCFLPLQPDSGQFFAANWDKPIGYVGETDWEGNDGNEYYDLYIPGSDLDTKNYDSRSVPNNQIETYSWLQDGMFVSYPTWMNVGVLYQTDGSVNQESSLLGTPGTTLEVLLSAGFMKSAAQNHYKLGWEAGAVDEGDYPSAENLLQVYTVGVDLNDTSFWSRARLYATMDPGEYFTGTLTADSPLADVFSDPEGQTTDLKIDNIYNGVEKNDDGGWGKLIGSYNDLIGDGDELVNSSVYEINNAYTAYRKWLDQPAQWNSYITTTGGVNRVYKGDTPTDDYTLYPIKIDQIEKPITYNNEDGNNITADLVDSNIDYVNQFFDVRSTNVSGIFQQILSLITGAIFNPVAGDNATGASDSITYLDPIGKYMEVKNPYTSGQDDNQDTGAETKPVKIDADLQMVHLGNMYGLVRTAEYDYQWNDQYQKNKDGTSGGEFASGWYYGEPTEEGNAGVCYAGKDSVPMMGSAIGTWPSDVPESYDSAQEAWEAGWVYRLDYYTTQQFVPTLVPDSSGTSSITEKQMNTVYTMYRFDWVQGSQSYNPDGSDKEKRYYFGGSEGEGSSPQATMERGEWLLNPAYAESAETAKLTWGGGSPGKLGPIDYVIDDQTYDEKTEAWTLPEPVDDPAECGLYRISDFRVWVEDSGDYTPASGEVTPDTAYDEALYFDVPSAAIPLQIADLTVDPDGKVLEYLTNLGGENDNFELVQWEQPGTDGAAPTTPHTYDITFEGDQLEYLVNTPGGGPVEGVLNGLIIGNKPNPEGDSSTITGEQKPGTIAGTTCTIEGITLTGNESFVVTNLPSGVDWTITEKGSGNPIWTGDSGTVVSPGTREITGTSNASTSVTATYLDSQADAGATLTVQNRVTGEDDVDIPLYRTYPFDVVFTKVTEGGETGVTGTVDYITSTGRTGTMTLGSGTTPSFVLNSGDSITFYGFSGEATEATNYKVTALSPDATGLSWSTGSGSSGTASTTGSLTGGDTLVTATYAKGTLTPTSQQAYYAQSTPCRLFYSVGVEDRVLYPSGNINVSALDAEYVQSHTTVTTQGARNSRIWFISNWWSGDGAGSTTKVRGNPATSFSPSPRNRYYVFQKSLPLYAVPKDNVDKLVDQTASTEEETVLKNFILAGDNGIDKQGDLSVGGVTCAPVSDGAGLTSDGWYYIVVEYFLPDANGGGRPAKMAVARKGSQFDDDVAEDSTADLGENLCWYDTENNVPGTNFSNSGPSYGKPEGDNWVLATREGCLRIGNMENNQREKAEVPKTQTNPDGKGGPTETAWDYFYPTATAGGNTPAQGDNPSSTEPGESPGTFENNVDVFLGNNGKLSISSTDLLVTKLEVNPEDTNWGSGGVTAPFKFNNPNLDSDEKYDYQVFVDGVEDTYLQATVVEYDKWSGLWRQKLTTVDALLSPQGFLLGSTGNDPVRVDESGEPSANGEYYVYLGGTGESPNETYPVYNSEVNYTEGNSPITIYVQGEVPSKPGPNGEKYREADSSYPAGTRQVSILNATLVLASKVTPDWSYNDGDGESNKVNLTFATVYLDRDEGLRSGVRFVSEFGSVAKYETRNLFFGYSSAVPPTVDPETGELNTAGAESLASTDLYDQTEFRNVKTVDGARTLYNTTGATNRPTQVSATDVARGTAEFTLESGEGIFIGGLKANTVYRVTERNEPSDGNYLVFGRNVQYANYVDYTSTGEWSGDTSGMGTGNAWNMLGNASVAGYYHFDNVEGTAANKYQTVDKIVNNTPENVLTPEGQPPVSNVPNTSAYFKNATGDSAGVFSMYGDTDAYEEATHFYNAPMQPVPVRLQVEKKVTGVEGQLEKEVTFTFDVVPDSHNDKASDPIQYGQGWDGTKLEFSINSENLESGSYAKPFFVNETEPNLPLEFTKPGEYKYYVREQQPVNPDAGWSYDPNEYTITVTVNSPTGFPASDPIKNPLPNPYYTEFTLATGKLSASVEITKADGIVVWKSGTSDIPTVPFNNTYNEKEVQVSFSAVKQLAGGQLSNDLFQFKLESFGNAPMPEGMESGDTVGNFGSFVTFPPIKYTNVGIYDYKLSEVPGADSGPFVYDGNAYLVEVEVSSDEGILKASTSYYKWVEEGNHKGELVYGPGETDTPVTFVNSQDLIIEKFIQGVGLDDQTFSFTLSLFQASDEPLTGDQPSATVYDADGEQAESQPSISWDETAGTLTFSLQPGQFLRVSGLPMGTKYTVSEGEPTPGQTFTPHWSQGTYDYNDDGIVLPSSGPQTPDGYPSSSRAGFSTGGNVGVDPYNYTRFRNSTETGSLTVTKQLGSGATQQGPFEFEVTFTDANGTPYRGNVGYSLSETAKIVTPSPSSPEATTGTLTPVGGKVTFTLAPDANVTFNGLPVGLRYQVTETNAGGLTTTWTSSPEGSATPSGASVSGTISGTSSVELTATNSDEPETGYGDLVVRKVATGEGAPTGETFHFTVNTTPPVSGTYGGVTFTDGVGSFDLKAGESKTFSNIPAGTRYTVTETSASNWKVSWQNQTGVVGAGQTTTATATNTWSPATVSLTGTKKFTGGDLEDGQFQFTIAPGADNPTPDPVKAGKVANDANGAITFFENATYEQVGTYTYTITEVKGDDPNITYDGTVYTVTVTVTEDPATGQLDARVDISPNGAITFTNTVSGGLTVRKVVEGDGAPTDQTFDFTVSFDPAPTESYTGVTSTGQTLTFSGPTASFTLKANESITFEGLPAGTHYTVTEQSAGNWELTWDGQTGEISAGATATATATNTWSPGRAWLDGTKVLVGGELQAGQFEFLVTPGAGNPQPDPVGERTVANGADGIIHFFDETFTAEGTYNYTITEVQGDDPGVTYDGSVWHATVTVTEDPETGELSAEVTLSPEGPIAFTNTEHTGDLTITKVVTGEGAPTDRTFRFRVTLDPPISGTFDGVTFTDGVAELELRAGQSLTLHGLPADTTYTVEELTTSGWTVTWEGQTGTIAEGETATATATNAWSPDHVHLDADKRLVGGELAEGQFQFLLTPGPDNPQPDPIGERTATNDASGHITLVDDAVFTVPGIYTYTVSEVPGDDPSIGYDSIVYTVTVTVTQDEATGQLTAEVTIEPDPGASGTMTFTNVEEGDRKVEVEPGAGRPVNPGDLVTYEISYRNDADTPGTVTIVDPVDAGLDFVSASGNGAYDPTGTLPADTTVGYAYHGTVTWAVPDVPPGGSGTVSVTFRVNRTAAETGAIRDQALIDWDNDHEPWTPTPDVPTNPFEWPTIVPQTGDGRPLILPTVLTAAAVAALVAAAWLLLRSGRSGTPGGYARDRRTHPRRR